MGLLPPSHSFSYLLTYIDCLTHWPEAAPITHITVETVAHAFIQCYMSRFGVPAMVTTVRGHQFESALWNQLMQLLGCNVSTLLYTTQGLIEYFHHQLKLTPIQHAGQNLYLLCYWVFIPN